MENHGLSSSYCPGRQIRFASAPISAKSSGKKNFVKIKKFEKTLDNRGQTRILWGMQV